MTPITHHMPAKDYHAIDALSNSRLKKFRESSWLYYNLYRCANPQPEPAPSDAMVIGSVVHDMLLLGWEAFDRNWILAPECDRRTKDGKEKWAEFLTTAGDRTVLSKDAYDTAFRIASEVVGNDTANKLLGYGADKEWNEVVLQWRSDILDGACKARIDRIVTPELFIDIKTASAVDERSWANQMARLGYHCQAAFYCQAGEAVFGKRPKFVFVVVQNKEPWEVAIYECPSPAIERGADRNTMAMIRLKRCLETNDWREERSKQILVVDLPLWAYRDEWSFE